jgi:hypothetical protein
MDFTVRTRWSRAVTVAARAGRAILDLLVEAGVPKVHGSEALT